LQFDEMKYLFVDFFVGRLLSIFLKDGNTLTAFNQ